MDLEVVGRHAMLFDDDAMAALVNSDDVLVEWNSLKIDRFDVRHLLSSPPPKRRRNCSSKSALLDDSSLESQLNHERYLDLPLHPDQPDVEEEKHRADLPGYHNVSLSYGDTDNYADEKKTEVNMESSGFLPHFPIPNDLLQSLPPTEKVHQIIARTALFVSKHGGQSEIILRVKQGDNPTFGFLMPGHHLHAYFRYLVEHIELLHSESDKKFQDEQKNSSIDHNKSNGVDGALILLGSVYGSGDEDEDDDNVIPERDVSHDVTSSSKTEASTAKTEPMSKNPIFANSEKVLAVKKNSSIVTSKSGTANGMGEKSCLSTTDVDKARNLTMAKTSKIKPLVLEPPAELKRSIDKLVELTMRKGKQFEETLIEQERQHERFPFLMPSDPYHFYYLKVLQTAQESKLNCKSSSSGKDGLLGHRLDQKNCAIKEKDDLSSLGCDMPLELDRKEKFSMVIGKSKKETPEPESNEAQQEWRIDASSAAAILQAATRGINNYNFRSSSIVSSSAYVSNNKEGGQPGDSSNPLSSIRDNAVEKSAQSESCNVSVVAPNTIGVGADPEALLTKEQKLKAERLQRAKRFVAMLKSGQVPSTTAGTSRGSSVEPQSRSTDEVNLDSKREEGNLAPAHVDAPATGEKPERNYFGEHNERPLNRKYRSRSDLCKDDDCDDKDNRTRNVPHSKGNGSRSKSGRHDERNNAIETEGKHHHRRHRSHSLSSEIEDERESNKEGKDRKNRKEKEREDRHDEDKNHERSSRKKRRKRRERTHSYHSDESEDEGEHSEKYEDDKNHKCTSKRHRRHHSSRERLKKRRSSKRSEDEGDDDYHESKGKHRSRDGGKHRHSRKDKKTRSKRKRETSSSDEHHNENERNELEEGEIHGRVSEERGGISSGDVISSETCTDMLSRQDRVPSQPLDTTVEIPGDLRAKIRAMLMSTIS